MCRKIILDLCGGTGSWSKPYKEAGYDVRVLTLPCDIRLLPAVGPVHGILAAPPCTEFSFAKHYHGKGNYTHDFKEGLSIVDACFRFITLSKPKWWALENPRGYLRRFLGNPQLTFDPWEFGDPYQKKTDIWGNFSIPKRSIIQKPENLLKFSLLKSKDIRPDMYGKLSRTERRAMTPAGFARAFYEANT
jgi:hypothetical protein